MSVTHYCPAFTQARGRGIYLEQRSACGLWVRMVDHHSPEPSCPLCKLYVESETETAKQLQDKWDLESGTKVITAKEQAS